MLTPQQIIEKIREDSTSTYNILLEVYNHPYLPWQKPEPTPEQLLEILKDYDGDNHGVHWWAGRYAQMVEDSEREPIRVPFTEEDINDLQEWEYFTWTYGGVQLFIFNTDSTPQFDKDSPYFDPTITV